MECYACCSSLWEMALQIYTERTHTTSKQRCRVACDSCLLLRASQKKRSEGECRPHRLQVTICRWSEIRNLREIQKSGNHCISVKFSLTHHQWNKSEFQNTANSSKKKLHPPPLGSLWGCDIPLLGPPKNRWEKGSLEKKIGQILTCDTCMRIFTRVFSRLLSLESEWSLGFHFTFSPFWLTWTWTSLGPFVWGTGNGTVKMRHLVML